LTDVLVLMEIQVNMSKQCLTLLVYIVQYRTLYLNFVSIQGFTGCSKNSKNHIFAIYFVSIDLL